MFSCEFCEVFKNIFFTEQHRATSSDVIPVSLLNAVYVNMIAQVYLNSIESILTQFIFLRDGIPKVHKYTSEV